MYKVEISVTGSKTDVKKKKPFNKYQINCLNKQQFKENSKVEQCYRLVSANTKNQLIKKKLIVFYSVTFQFKQHQ